MRIWYVLGAAIIVAGLVTVIFMLIDFNKIGSPAPKIVYDAPGETKVIAERVAVPVILTSQFFEPSEINVSFGTEINIQILSLDGDHVVMLPAYGNTFELRDGQRTNIRFQPGEPGVHTLLCIDKCEAGVVLTMNIE